MSLTKTEYNVQLAKQGGLCAACGKAEMVKTPIGMPWSMMAYVTDSLDIPDKDKTKLLTYGILCHDCSAAAELLHWDTARADGMVKYLKSLK